MTDYWIFKGCFSLFGLPFQNDLKSLFNLFKSSRFFFFLGFFSLIPKNYRSACGNAYFIRCLNVVFPFLGLFLVPYVRGFSSVFIQLAFQVFSVNPFHINHPVEGVDNFLICS